VLRLALPFDDGHMVGRLEPGDPVDCSGCSRLARREGIAIPAGALPHMPAVLKPQLRGRKASQDAERQDLDVPAGGADAQLAAEEVVVDVLLPLVAEERDDVP
jgi:hypothetical protein